MKHFSPTRVHKSQFWPFSTEQGRCFFHCGCMPGTGAIRWGDISFRTRPRRSIEPPILTRRTRDQQTGGTGVMDTEGHGRGAGGRRQGQNKHTRPKPHPIGGHRVACGARPRCRRDRRARAGFEIDHSEPQARVWRSRGRPGPPAPGTPAGPQASTRGADGSRAGRRPRAHKAARPKKHTRRPEHQRHSTSPATGKGKPTAPGTP